MVVHFYEISGCTCANIGERPVLVAPAGTPQALLTKYDFLLVEDGRWCHFLTTPEYEHVMTGYPDRDVVFGSTVMMPEPPAVDPTAGNRLADIGLILLVASILLPMLTGGVTFLLGDTAQENVTQTAEAATTVLLQAVSSICSLCGIASFVIMIITRVKYPKNTRGKVLMWIFVVLAILFALAMIVLILACASCLDSMRRCS